jgi:hypothetical protein
VVFWLVSYHHLVSLFGTHQIWDYGICMTRITDIHCWRVADAWDGVNLKLTLCRTVSQWVFHIWLDLVSLLTHSGLVKITIQWSILPLLHFGHCGLCVMECAFRY